MRIAAAAGLAACVGMMAGCGNSYRPVVATVGIPGPAGQPQKYAIAISTPTPPGAPCPAAGQPTSNGLMTMVDFAGDTTLVTVPLGVNPYYLYLNSVGTIGYTLNCDKTVDTFPLTTTLIASQILESTLPTGTNPVSVLATQSAEYITDPGVNAIDQLFSSPPALKQTIPIASGYSPIYTVGQTNAARIYALSQATNGGAGQATAIETSGNTVSATLPVGRGPVYGVMTADTRRVFVLNQTDGTVSVINTQTDMLDTPVNTIPVGCTPTGGATTCPNSRPVWADLAPGPNELVVANEGTGTSPGSLSIINIPLCTTTALPTNPNCDAANPIDASTFGQTVATVPVGINPIMVTVLGDFTRAYVANAGTGNYPCSGTTSAVFVGGVQTKEACTVSVVNLVSDTVTATIPINGHPVYIASSNSVPAGKVYVVCKDSQVMTVIKTDTDSFYLTIPLQGYGISVRTSAP
jgi:YVTN family beta-propeller protein